MLSALSRRAEAHMGDGGGVAWGHKEAQKIIVCARPAMAAAIWKSTLTAMYCVTKKMKKMKKII